MIRFRSATPNDIPLLRRWEQQPHVRAAGIEDWDWEEDLSLQSSYVENLIAELDGRPIGFMQLCDPAREEGHYWGEVDENLCALDIWIGEPDLLGKGYGTLMMRLAFERCFADPAVKGILIDPRADNTGAHRFYERLGFHFLEERIFREGDLCKVYFLSREDWENPGKD